MMGGSRGVIPEQVITPLDEHGLSLRLTHIGTFGPCLLAQSQAPRHRRQGVIRYPNSLERVRAHSPKRELLLTTQGPMRKPFDRGMRNMLSKTAKYERDTVTGQPLGVSCGIWQWQELDDTITHLAGLVWSPVGRTATKMGSAQPTRLPAGSGLRSGMVFQVRVTIYPRKSRNG